MSQAAPRPGLLALHLDLTGRRVLVVGAGTVAARKVATALDAAAKVTVIAPTAVAEITALVDAGRVRWQRRRVRRRDLRGAWVVFAATDSPAVNALMSRHAERRRIPCVRADLGPAGTARSPAVLRRDGILVGISSDSRDRVDPRRVCAVRDAVAAGIDHAASVHS